jgi:hypothetical protein
MVAALRRTQSLTGDEMVRVVADHSAIGGEPVRPLNGDLAIRRARAEVTFGQTPEGVAPPDDDLIVLVDGGSPGWGRNRR